MLRLLVYYELLYPILNITHRSSIIIFWKQYFFKPVKLIDIGKIRRFCSDNTDNFGEYANKILQYSVTAYI